MTDINVIHCWPKQWIKAAQKAGLATYTGDGKWEFLSDKMRDALGAFAKEIVENAIAVEREECAKVCDERAKRPNDGNFTDEEWDMICGANELAADDIRRRDNNK